MKISLNTDSSNLLIQAKEISGLNFNDLLKEAMTLLVIKYRNSTKHEDQYDQNLVGRLKKVRDEHPNLDINDPLSLAFNDIFSSGIEKKSTDFHLREHVIEEIGKLRDFEIGRYLRYRYQYDVYPVKKILSN